MTSCFKLTKVNNEDLDIINRNFLWLPNMALVAWDDVGRAKFEVDLRIRRNNDVNKTSIYKLSWRILTIKKEFGRGSCKIIC